MRTQFSRFGKLATLSVLLPLGCSTASKTTVPQTGGDSLAQRHQAVIDQGKDPNFEIKETVGPKGASYPLLVHSVEMIPLIQSNYNAKSLGAVENFLKESLQFSVDGRGLARAADRVGESDNDPTHYDAVWVRDSLWIYLGMRAAAEPQHRAKKLLLTLADYFSSNDQLNRMNAVIENPAILAGEEGRMNAIHIRFDRRSSTFQDVQEGGKAQVWNHKQNDALGLYLDLFCRAILSGEISPQDLNANQLKVIQLLPKYFDAIQFYQMADAGSWEEIERVNTSSIGLVTSGLERLVELSARFPKATTGVDFEQVKKLIDLGYQRIFQQLQEGGESPSYSTLDPHFRTSDAALLNLIFPARLSRLQRKDYEHVLKIVQPLIGDAGIKRYLHDSYQSGNFWFNQASTADTSTENSFSTRGKQFIEDSEAQWFFDSWYSVVLSTLYQKYKTPAYHEAAIRFFNRSLAQITGGTKEHPVFGADGKTVPARSTPESYNTVIDFETNSRVFAPSPITPLNWAKATLRLAIKKLK